MTDIDTDALLQRIAELEAHNAVLESECSAAWAAVEDAVKAARGSRQLASAQAQLLAKQGKAIRRVTGEDSDAFASNPHLLPAIQQLYQRDACSQESCVDTCVIADAIGVSRRTAQAAISLLRSAGFVASCRGYGVWLTARGIKAGRRCAAAKKKPTWSSSLTILATVSAAG